MAIVSKKELNRFLREIDGASLTALSDVTAGYGYYRRYLKSSVTGRFEWQGLPATMDAHILEDMLISEGAVIPIVCTRMNRQNICMLTPCWGVCRILTWTGINRMRA